MNPKAFSFNSDVKYPVGVQDTASSEDVSRLAKAHVQVQAVGAADDTSFETHYPDVFEKYRLPNISSDTLVQAWNSFPMQFWQNQLNFAVWCATTGCGVSVKDHLIANDPLLQSLYRFHVYYQTRQILEEVQAPLPQDQAWRATSNPYDCRAYERICDEFGVSPHSDWRAKGPNNGLGRVYLYAAHRGYMPVYGGGGSNHYNSARMSFTKQTTNTVLHVDFIKQDAPDADRAWTKFILDRSQGFTRSGVERLNDSIRTYVWAILGTQAQTRTGILGTGTAFDAQKHFLANIEDAISSPVDLPSSIERYQNILRYAGSEVNFVFGIGLYMAPSDMLLYVGRVSGYNNEIVIATADQTLGVNRGINMAIVPPDAPTDTGQVGLVELSPGGSRASAGTGTSGAAVAAHQTAAVQAHEDKKTALTVGAIAVGLGVFWLLKPLSRIR